MRLKYNNTYTILKMLMIKCHPKLYVFIILNTITKQFNTYAN